MKKFLAFRFQPVAKILKELSSGLFRFGAEASQIKLEALKVLENAGLLKPLEIKEYQRCLLFIAAYPETFEEHRSAIRGLKKIREKIQKLNRSSASKLEQSGLPATKMYGVYSYHLVEWALKNKTLKIELSFLEKEALHPKEALAHSFEELEFDLETRDLSALNWLEQAFGTENKNLLLKHLVEHIRNLPLNGLQKDQLFESMRVCVSVECGTVLPLAPSISTTFLHKDGLQKRLEAMDLLSKPLPQAKKLKPNECRELITCARLSLLYLNRETDPISLCDSEGIEYFELERGFSIALFSTVPERRLPLESYIGFMMFKNGLPLAYGGAWLFGNRSLLGINIYESYRGGESSYLFAQLLRTYKQRFSPSYIEIEPYQFGKGNPEGIKTGAFWFYYRFGFRPVDTSLRKLAGKEFHKIQKNKGYKSPIPVLKQFTNSNLSLLLDESKFHLDPSIVSAYITETIHSQFQGNRAHFKRWKLSELKKNLNIDFNELSKHEKMGLEKLAGFVCVCLDHTLMTKAQKAELTSLIKEKGKSEFNYAFHLEKFPFEKFIRPEVLKSIRMRSE